MRYELEFKRDIESVRKILNKPLFIMWLVKSKAFLETFKKAIPIDKKEFIDTPLGFMLVSEDVDYLKLKAGKEKIDKYMAGEYRSSDAKEIEKIVNSHDSVAFRRVIKRNMDKLFNETCFLNLCVSMGITVRSEIVT